MLGCKAVAALHQPHRRWESCIPRTTEPSFPSSHSYAGAARAGSLTQPMLNPLASSTALSRGGGRATPSLRPSLCIQAAAERETSVLKSLSADFLSHHFSSQPLPGSPALTLAYPLTQSIYSRIFLPKTQENTMRC